MSVWDQIMQRVKQARDPMAAAMRAAAMKAYAPADQDADGLTDSGDAVPTPAPKQDDPAWYTPEAGGSGLRSIVQDIVGSARVLTGGEFFHRKPTPVVPSSKPAPPAKEPETPEMEQPAYWRALEDSIRRNPPAVDAVVPASPVVDESAAPEKMDVPQLGPPPPVDAQHIDHEDIVAAQKVQAQSPEDAAASAIHALPNVEEYDKKFQMLAPQPQPSADNQYRMSAEQTAALPAPPTYDAAKQAAMESGDPRIQSLMTNPAAQEKAGVSESQMAAIISGAQGGNAQALKVLHSILGEPDTDEMAKQEMNRLLQSPNRQERLQGMQMAVQLQEKQRAIAAQQANREDNQAAILERQKEAEAERSRLAGDKAAATKAYRDQTDKEQAAKVLAQQGDALGMKLDKLAKDGKKGSDGQWASYFKARGITDPDLQKSMREAHEEIADSSAQKAKDAKELTDWRKEREQERIDLEREARDLRKTAKDAEGKEKAVTNGIRIAAEAMNKGHADISSAIVERLKKQYPDQAQRIDDEVSAKEDDASKWRAMYNEARIADANGTATPKQKAILEEGRKTSEFAAAFADMNKPSSPPSGSAQAAVPAGAPAQQTGGAQPPKGIDPAGLDQIIADGQVRLKEASGGQDEFTDEDIAYMHAHPNEAANYIEQHIEAHRLARETQSQ